MVAVCPGRLVILDEPTNDVDPLRRRMLWQQVRALGDQGAAVLLVTHNVLEAEKAVDRLAIIDNGRLLAEGTPSAMKEGDRGQLRLQLMIAPGRDAPSAPLFARRSTVTGRTLMAVIDEADAAEGIKWAQQAVASGDAEEYALGATSLEDAYIELTGHGPDDGGDSGHGRRA
jgi:ABC-2 type transport system ATP-binding protein